MLQTSPQEAGLSLILVKTLDMGRKMIGTPPARLEMVRSLLEQSGPFGRGGGCGGGVAAGVWGAVARLLRAGHCWRSATDIPLSDPAGLSVRHCV